MVIIALGGNLPRSNGGSVAETFADAAHFLGDNAVSVLAESGLYRSPAWPPSDQPDYLNAVWQVKTDRAPGAFLQLLHDAERHFGRVREGAPVNAARTLDLDLIDFNGAVRGAAPVLPHPRMHRRAFVLLPLAEFAPDWRHPVSRRSIRELIDGLPADHHCVRA